MSTFLWSGAGHRLFRAPSLRIKTPDFTMYQLNEAANAGLWEIAEKDKLEIVS